MDLSLKGMRALVCGSSQGIGKEIAIELANEGVEVLLIARNEEKLNSVLNELSKKNNQNHRYIVADFENGIPENSILFKQSSMNMTFETASDNPLVGDSYFKMGGRMGWNEWMLGQIDIPLDLSDVSSTPENFYLNLGVLSGLDGELASDQYINILISESNSPFNGDLTNNGADVFKDTMEVYKYQIRPVDWVGWKYIAVSYNEFEVKSAGGDNIRSPKDIKAIRIQCQSCPSASGNCPGNAGIDVRTDIDYVLFTENEKLLDQE